MNHEFKATRERKQKESPSWKIGRENNQEKINKKMENKISKLRLIPNRNPVAAWGAQNSNFFAAAAITSHVGLLTSQLLALSSLKFFLGNNPRIIVAALFTSLEDFSYQCL